jgi:predicted metalloprotease with PDZ domain
MTKPFFHVQIDLTRPESHRAKVTIRRAAEELPGILEFPVWTPGSYLVREYSRHVTCLEPAVKIAKNRWQVAGGTPAVHYEVYCFERTVRTSYADDKYAVLVGASLLPLLHGPYELELKLPSSWKMVSSALKFRRRGPGRWTTSIRDDDQWIDSPIVAAAPGYGGTATFRVKGIPHHIAWVGLHCSRSMKEMQEAFARIAATTLRFFGGAPFKEYWFLLHFGHKIYGGLEHRDSQLSQYDGTSLADAKDWDGFLRLIAHEYFHSWNVKSIRPRALGPFEYSCENYTQDIWFAEGLTDYFDDLIPLEAGLIGEDAYWKARLKDASQLPDGAPGHRRRSLAESSFDAWVRYYRNDEDSINTDVSYYSKGALLGWCWDAHLRKKTKGRWTLARLMRAIWKEFGIDAYEPLTTAKPGFNREELLSFCEKTTGASQAKQLESWVTGRKPLPWREAARYFKVNFEEKVCDQALHFLGLQLQWKSGTGTVQRVLSGTAAEAAGVAPQDELLAVNGMRTADGEKFLRALREGMKKGKEVELLLCRLDKVMHHRIRWRRHDGIGVEYINR